jgi:hypothetical protein
MRILSSSGTVIESSEWARTLYKELFATQAAEELECGVRVMNCWNLENGTWDHRGIGWSGYGKDKPLWITSA